MVRLTFIEPDGQTHTVEVVPGGSLMAAAKARGIAGIAAECGGAGVCATCHVFIDEDWLKRLSPRTPIEEELLEFTESAITASRLACQVTVSEELSGLRVTIPA